MPSVLAMGRLWVHHCAEIEPTDLSDVCISALPLVGWTLFGAGSFVPFIAARRAAEQRRVRTFSSNAPRDTVAANVIGNKASPSFHTHARYTPEALAAAGFSLADWESSLGEPPSQAPRTPEAISPGQVLADYNSRRRGRWHWHRTGRH
jgi:hypothetical protein